MKRLRSRTFLRLHLEADQAPGGVAQDEEAVDEHLGAPTVLVGSEWVDLLPSS